ncbi:MAG: UDP-N-acetylglucosamine 2-epimerase (hydrolyzing) [Kordiimonadaceae bacterium]|nr:UDP-N-acetylglucosamine 2-epimerase (hydrolyzing) [Kordiimonadaceae bacterium]
MSKRTILVVTGTRADYGLLRWIMQAIDDSPKLELQIVATMMHLSPEFGSTYRDIEQDGFTLTEKLDILDPSDTPQAMANSMAKGVSGFAEVFGRLKPDMVFLLGDRVEMLAAATAATLCQLPIAHIHGGETTEGLIDEPIRHSITKMAHVHFATTRSYQKRIIQLGEHPDSVLHVGAPGLELLHKVDLLSRSALEETLGFKLGTPTFVVTYHPVTLETRPEGEAFGQMLAAFKAFPTAKYIITYPNSDARGRGIIDGIRAFEQQHAGHVFVTPSLGQLRYLSAVKHCDAVVGNSSSGLIEVPSLGVPTVNIGRRQLGRIAPESVVHCGESTVDIVAAMQKALSPEFRKTLAGIDTLYGSGHVAGAVVARLEAVSLNDILFKSFYDLER